MLFMPQYMPKSAQLLSMRLQDLMIKCSLSVALTLCLFCGASAQAGQDKPSWGGQKTDLPSEPAFVKDIPDIFARGAVTVEDMISLAKTQKYLPGELVVAIESQMERKQAIKQIKSYDWVSLFKGREAIFLSHVLSSARPNGSTVSLALLKLPAGLEVFEAMKLIESHSSVMWSSPNFYYEGDPRDYTPNDPRYNEQYHHPRMQNNLAWDITKGNPGVIVAFTDDGCELTHSDLSANIWINADEIPGNGIDDDNNGFIDDINGWDFAFNNNNPANNASGDSHGTHVGGIIGARIDNNIGVAGVAGLSTIMPIQFYGTGGAAWTATMNAQSFAYAVDNGAKIINTSYNIDGFSTSAVFLAGVQYVIDNNCIHFNSAGNNNQLNPPRQAVTQTLLIASTTSTDAKSSFSNYGTGVDVSAPGSSILSSVPGNTYSSFSGTSMATPNAAGAAALIWSANPGWTNYQVACQLLATADNIDAVNPTFIGQLGSGRVNSYRALTVTIPAPQVKSTSLPNEGTGIASGTLSSFTLAYTQIMDPVSANNASNYSLLSAGTNGVFGDGDDALIALTLTTTYRIGTNFLTFTLPNALTCGNYRFTIQSGGLKNPFNTSLDGDANNTAGGNFVRNFFVGTTVFTDADGDGYGTGTAVQQAVCSVGNGFSLVGGDCNDNDPVINPGATEICGNGIDENCDGLIDFVQGAQGAAQVFSNSNATTIPAIGVSNPYPSNITVTGRQGTISKLRVKFNQFSHTWPSDVDVLLVGPAGQKMIIMSDVGGNSAVSNVTFTLDDAASAAIGTTLVNNSIYRPTNAGANDPFAAPAPAGPYQNPASGGTATFASVFNNSNPNGTWSLYVVDDGSGDAGTIGSWELEISTFVNLCEQVPTPTATVSQTTCTSATGSITVTAPLGAQYSYNIGGASQAAPVFNNVSPGTYVLTATNTATGSSASVNVTVNPQPVVPATPGPVQGLQSVCAFVNTNTPLTYSVNEVPGATTYNWILPPTVTLVSGQGTRSITVTINSNFATNVNRLIKVSASSVCGTSAESSYLLQAIIPGTPAAIVASSNNVCPSIGTGITISYTTRKVSSASSYLWTAQAGTTIISHPNGIGENDTTVAVSFTSAFSTSLISVQATNGCGTSSARSLNITRNNPGTPSLITGPTNVCNFSAPNTTAATYTVTQTPTVALYNWTVPAGAIGLTGQGSNSISFIYPNGYSGGVISVNASNGCGTSENRNLTVTRLNPGAIGSINVVLSAGCPSRVYRYTIPSMPTNSTSIQWTVPAGGTIVSGQGTTSISVSYTTAAIIGRVTVTALNNCGGSSSRGIDVKLPVCAASFTGNGINPGTGQSITNGIDAVLYPNPTVSSSQLMVYSMDRSIIRLRIVDAQGRLIRNIIANPNENIDINGISMSGVYFIEIMQGKNRLVKKFVKL